MKVNYNEEYDKCGDSYFASLDDKNIFIVDDRDSFCLDDNIYVIDSNQVKGSLKALGLNCPNCGAPIKSLDKKVCSYCQTGIVDLVKKSFVLNDIYEY